MKSRGKLVKTHSLLSPMRVIRHAEEGKRGRVSRETRISPGVGAISEQSFEVFPGDEFTAVHPGLDGPQPTEDPDLFHSTHHGRYVQSLQLGVHCMQPSHQVLQEEIKDLREADQLLAVHQERSHLHPMHVDHPALGVAAASTGTTDSAAPCAATVVIGHKTVDHIGGETRRLSRSRIHWLSPKKAPRDASATGSCRDHRRCGDSHGHSVSNCRSSGPRFLALSPLSPSPRTRSSTLVLSRARYSSLRTVRKSTVAGLTLTLKLTHHPAGSEPPLPTAARDPTPATPPPKTGSVPQPICCSPSASARAKWLSPSRRWRLPGRPPSYLRPLRVGGEWGCNLRRGRCGASASCPAV